MTATVVRPEVLRAGQPGGACVVFAHGLEDGWASWRPLVRLVEPAWRAVALDLPWRAGNDYGWRRHSAAAWLSAGLDAVDGPVDLLVAHSFGANAALELMAGGGLPQVGAVALVCPLYRPPRAPVTWEMFDLARQRFEAHIRDGVRARLGPRALATGPDVLDRMSAKAVERVGPAGLLTAFDRFVASAELDLEAIGHRVIVLAGGHDPTLRERSARLLGERMARATVLVDPELDHFCHIRMPDAVLGHLCGFLGATSDAPPTSQEATRR